MPVRNALEGEPVRDSQGKRYCTPAVGELMALVISEPDVNRLYAEP